MIIKNVNANLLKKQLDILMKKKGFVDAVELKNNKLTITIDKTLEHANTLIKAFPNNFTMKDNTKISEVDKQTLIENGANDNTLLAISKGTLLVAFDTEFVLNVVNPTVNVNNIEVFDNAYKKADNKFFLELGIFNFYDVCLDYISNSRLKTLNINELLYSIEENLHQTISDKAVTSQENRASAIEIPYWMTFEINSYYKKTEVLLYILYLTLGSIQNNKSKDESIRLAINSLSSIDLKGMTDFYNDSELVYTKANSVKESYDLHEDFINLNFSDNSFDISIDDIDLDSEMEDVYGRLNKVIFEEYFGIILSQMEISDIFGKKYKNLTQLNTVGLPQIASQIKTNLDEIKRKVKIKIVESGLTADLKLISNSVNHIVARDKTVFKKFSIQELKTLLVEDINDQNSDVFVDWVYKYSMLVCVKIVVGNDRDSYVNSLFESLDNQEYIIENLSKLTHLLKVLQDNKVLTKSMRENAENKIVKAVSLKTLADIKDNNTEQVIELYKKLFEGGL